MVLIVKRAARVAAAIIVLGVTAHAQGRGGGGVGGGTPSGRARPVIYGFALVCIDCQPMGRGRIGGGGVGGVGRGEGRAGDATRPFSYTSYPRVVAVAPGGVAENAGIREGDVLMSIDGLSILTEEGAQRFVRATAGEEVRLTFERDSKTIDIPLVLGRTISGRGLGRGVGGTLRSFPTQIVDGYMSARYSGAYGNIDLQVWSEEPVTATRDSTGAMILRMGTTVVRLKSDLVDSTAVPRGRGEGRGLRGSGVGRGRGTPPQ